MTNNTRARDPRVEDYVDQCEQHFHDLPPDVQRSLADDVREIVSEVASQLDGNPADLVGEPQAFCAELRAAAGYPPTAEQLDSGLDNNPGVFTTLRDAVRETAWPATKDFTKELRPAWWLVRGLGFALLFDPDHLRNDFHLFPQIQGSAILWLLVAAASVVASIGLGRGTLITSRRRRTVAVWVMSAMALGFLINEVGNIDHLGQTTTSQAFAATDPGNAFHAPAIEDTVVPSVFLEVFGADDGQAIYSDRLDPTATLQALRVRAPIRPESQPYLVVFPNEGVSITLASYEDVIEFVETRYFNGALPVVSGH